jgi:antitoxin HicB
MTIKPKYSVLIRALPDEDGGGWVAIVPDLPGCSSDGETQMEALKNVEDAIEVWLQTAEEHGQRIPRPDDFITVAFPQDVPDKVWQRAEYIVRQMHKLPGDEEPDPTLVHAVYTQLARSAVKHAHL